MEFTKTKLWKTAFGDAKSGTPESKLTEVYFKFWKNTIELAKGIQANLPNLTLHDEKHFEALWRRADQICGKKPSLNPLEVFVFGCAILLHDLALTLRAFKGGKAELQDTPQWSDAVSRNMVEVDGVEVPLTPEQEKGVLFETLRAIHAERASKLADLSFETGGNTIFLFDDSDLRKHLGQLIGRIAASHHWDISKLQPNFQQIVGSPSGFPENWSIRPILIACLLRCADAIQLDQSRAPDFVYAMLKPSGVSDHHWKSQNRVSAPVLDPSDNGALLFTSTKPFEPDDAEAWWVLHDAIQVANRELQSVNSLLKDLQLPAFTVSRIGKCETPQMLATTLQVKDWQPVLARIQISNVSKVVTQFGGSQLYGDNPTVALRELIQNAADAIRLRKALEPDGFEGKITVKLTALTDEIEKRFRLDVEDNGLGMSESVLCGPLIDFGSSYITSSLVRIERPGLVGKKLKLSGKYGIGFFSVFMLGDHVEVTTRPFDSGSDKSRTLKFPSGIHKQPLLLNEKPIDYSVTTSTRVSVVLTEERLVEITTISIDKPYEKNQFSLGDIVAALTPQLEFEVWLDHGGTKSKAHDPNDSASKLLQQALLLEDPRAYQNKAKLSHIDKLAGLMEPIDYTNPLLGIAAVAIDSAECGVPVIGGLTTDFTRGKFSEYYVGFMECVPSGPSRSVATAVALQKIPDWSTRQAIKLASIKLSPAQKYFASARISAMGGDATPIASIMVNRKILTIKQIAAMLCSKKSTIYIAIEETDSNAFNINYISVNYAYWNEILDTKCIQFEKTVIEFLEGPRDRTYANIPQNIEGLQPTSFFALLLRFVSSQGFEIQKEFVPETKIGTYIGLSSERDGVKQGEKITMDCLKIWAVPKAN